MNSKERVLCAASLSVPDRIPMDYHGNRWVLERLKRDMGTEDHRDLLRRLGSDIVDIRGLVDPVYRGPVPYSRELPGAVKESFWGWRQKTVEAACGPEETYVDFPLSRAVCLEDLARHTWPDPEWFDFSDILQRLEPWEDFAVMASGVSVWQHPSFLRGLDNLLCDLSLDAEMAGFMMDRFTDFYLGYFERLLSAAEGRIDILRQADDLGTQHSLIFSPEMFRSFVKPRIARFVDLAHSFGAKFMFHSCGAIRPFIDDLIEIGVDILDPLQAAAIGMEPEGLKADFGSRICLHGGVDTQFLLPQGSPEEVRDEVRRRVEQLGPQGGFILAPCHLLQMDVPTANILAMSQEGASYIYENGRPVRAGGF